MEYYSVVTMATEYNDYSVVFLIPRDIYIYNIYKNPQRNEKSTYRRNYGTDYILQKLC